MRVQRVLTLCNHLAVSVTGNPVIVPAVAPIRHREFVHTVCVDDAGNDTSPQSCAGKTETGPFHDLSSDAGRRNRLRRRGQGWLRLTARMRPGLSGWRLRTTGGLLLLKADEDALVLIGLHVQGPDGVSVAGGAH